MYKLLTFLLGILCVVPTFAQSSDTLKDTSLVHQHHHQMPIGDTTSPYIISLITCGAGNQVYSFFGHTAIRIQHQDSGIDEVYNYGTFDSRGEGFLLNFILGKAKYELDKTTMNQFLDLYKREGRYVKAQVLQLTSGEKEKFYQYLEKNLKEENRYYVYKYFDDNCATRVRDAIDTVLAGHFAFGDILRNKQTSYRDIMNQYLQTFHWERFGLNILLGMKTDQPMTNDGALFMPELLYKSVAEGINDKMLLAKPSVEILPNTLIFKRNWNVPFLIFTALFVLTLLSFLLRPLAKLKVILKFLILLITGALGLFMIFMWIGSNHLEVKNNYNILWALPTNLFLAFIINRPKRWFKIYGLLGISLIMVVMAVQLIGLQQFPIVELLPILGCLLYIYVDIYKQALLEEHRAGKDALLNQGSN